MTYCSNCIHYKVCGNEGVDDSAMTFCADKMTNEEAISYLKWIRPIKPYSLDKKKVQESIDMAIKALKQTDGDSISKQAVIGIVEFECGEWKGLAKTIIKAIEQMPNTEKTAEVSPMQVELEADGYADGELVYDFGKCPNCGWEFEEGDKDWEEPFCCHCGQKLKWFETEEEE